MARTPADISQPDFDALLAPHGGAAALVAPSIHGSADDAASTPDDLDEAARAERTARESEERQRALREASAAGRNENLTDPLTLALQTPDAPKIDVPVDEMMQAVPATIHRGLEHINAHQGLRDPQTGQTVRLSEAELDRASHLVTVLALSVTDDYTNNRGVYFTEAVVHAGFGVAEGLGEAALNGATAAVEGYQASPSTNPDTGDVLDYAQNTARAIGNAALEGAEAAGQAAEAQYEETVNHINQAQASRAATELYVLMASAMPGVEMGQSAVNGRLDGPALEYLKVHVPDVYNDALAAAGGNPENIRLRSVVDALGQIQGGAVGSAAYAMTAAIPSQAENHQRTQVPMSMAMYNPTDISETMTFADLVWGGDMPFASHMVAKYQERGLVVQNYNGAAPVMASAALDPADFPDAPQADLPRVSAAAEQAHARG